MKKTKILILFGAGASSDLSGVYPSNPPVGSNLFNELAIEYQNSWKKLIYLKKEFKDFENGIAIHLNKKHDDLYPLLKDMALFFSKYRIQNPEISYPKKNYYVEIINRYKKSIISGELKIGTINYDCLIENALIFNNIDYYTQHKIQIYKMHGSCNYIIGKIKAKNFKFGFDVKNNKFILKGKIKGKPTIVSPSNVKKLLKKGHPLIMALYAKEKPIFIGEDYLKTIIKNVQEFILESELVILVGIRPNIEDTHIWNYLSKTNAKLLLVGNRKKCKKWGEKYRGLKFYKFWRDENTKIVSYKKNFLTDIFHEIDQYIEISKPSFFKLKIKNIENAKIDGIPVCQKCKRSIAGPLEKIFISKVGGQLKCDHCGESFEITINSKGKVIFNSENIRKILICKCGERIFPIDKHILCNKCKNEIFVEFG